MGIFKKKEKEEDEEIEGKSKKRKPASAEATSRRRKKSPKPWGKKERIAVVVVFVLTVFASGVLSLRSRNWEISRFPRLTLPEVKLSLPELGIFGRQTIVLEGKRDNLGKSEKVISDFKTVTGGLSGVYGFYIISLSDGYSFGVNENAFFEPASLNKLPVIYAAYKADREGRIDLNDEYELKDEDKIRGSGSLSGGKEGTVYTYRKLVTLMGKESDNTSFGIMKRLLGQEYIDSVIDEIGMVDTSFEDNRTTPTDIGTFFKHLVVGDLPQESREAILSSLTDTIYENHLPAGIPRDIKVAHKYGRETRVVNDGGIVFSGDSFVLVILSEGVLDKEADEKFPELSRLIFEGLTD